MLNGLILPSTEVEKDLGVHMDPNLKWSEHIQKCISKANSVIGWTRRNVISRDKDVILNIYKSLIRPHLEYAVQLWNPPPHYGNWGTIMELEKVQRSVTRMISGIGLLPYEERLKELKLTTLLERRYRGDLIETYKITMNHVPYCHDLFRMSRSGYNIIKVPGKGTFLPNRIANYWNKIPNYVKDAPTMESFKHRLESYKAKYRTQGALGHYWEVGNYVFDRINDSNRDSYVNFMINNPAIAKRKHVNIC